MVIGARIFFPAPGDTAEIVVDLPLLDQHIGGIQPVLHPFDIAEGHINAQFPAGIAQAQDRVMRLGYRNILVLFPLPGQPVKALQKRLAEAYQHGVLLRCFCHGSQHGLQIGLHITVHKGFGGQCNTDFIHLAILFSRHSLTSFHVLGISGHGYPEKTPPFTAYCMIIPP